MEVHLLTGDDVSVSGSRATGAVVDGQYVK